MYLFVDHVLRHCEIILALSHIFHNGGSHISFFLDFPQCGLFMGLSGLYGSFG